MSNRNCESKENLARQLIGYIKLSRQPHLSAGARTVLQLQIAHIENQLRNMDGL